MNSTTLLRWLKFNAVGALGMAVQLSTLALFNHLSRGHYLYATTAALELTLVHNFLWHLHYTWRDRRPQTHWPEALLRFHVTNGLISLVGNLLLMRLLIHTAHLPLLASNLIAILCCSLANFCAGSAWAFATPKPAAVHPAAEGHSSMRIQMISLTVLYLVLSQPASAGAQTSPAEQPVRTSSPASSLQTLSPAPPQAPPWRPPAITYHATPSASYTYNAGIFCGIGSTSSSVATKPTAGCGAGITFVPLPLFLEFGVMAPQANRSNISAYFSVDSSIPLAGATATYLPLAIVGYSRLFETGHSLDYGLALALPRPGKRRESSDSLRIELRDYCTFANPTQHNIMLRIGLMSEVAD